MKDEIITITGADGIKYAHLAALKGALKLEGLGLKRRGRSALAIAKEEFGLYRGCSRAEVIAHVEREMDEILKTRARKILNFEPVE